MDIVDLNGSLHIKHLIIIINFIITLQMVTVTGIIVLVKYAYQYLLKFGIKLNSCKSMVNYWMHTVLYWTFMYVFFRNTSKSLHNIHDVFACGGHKKVACVCDVVPAHPVHFTMAAIPIHWKVACVWKA